MPTPVRPIRFLHPFLSFPRGHVVAEPSMGWARTLIQNNIAEYADQPQNGYVHRMMEPIKRKRGRPRKEQ